MTAVTRVSRRRIVLFALILVVAIFGGMASAPPAAAQTTVYSNDFSVAAGPEWSPSMTIFTTPSGERMLGDPFSNITESLTLTGLPAHTDVTISFDLYILRSWDGNGEFGFGPDFWTADVSGGPTLQPTTTFANLGCSGLQSYPSPYPAVFPPTTGAAAVGTLGYGVGCFGDSTYHFSFTFAHSASSITFNFAGSNLQGWADEGWGLDNVVVEVKEPPRVPQHFLRYQLDQPEFSGELVGISDQFGTLNVRLEEAAWLWNPAEKRRDGREPEPIQREDEHLVCYGLPYIPTADRFVVVRNQFTESRLRVGRPLTLCTPASKSPEGDPGPPPDDLDHYLCYDVRGETPILPSETFGVRDQFGSRTVRIDRARELCNPAEKRREGREPEPIIRPEEHFVCYRITIQTPAFAPVGVITNDQFNRLQALRVRTLERVCVPSTKDRDAAA